VDGVHFGGGRNVFELRNGEVLDMLGLGAFAKEVFALCDLLTSISSYYPYAGN